MPEEEGADMVDRDIIMMDVLHDVENRARPADREQVLFSLVGEGLLSLGAAAWANLGEDEFRARMERDGQNGQ